MANQHTGKDHIWKAKFLEAMAVSGNVTVSARSAGVTRQGAQAAKNNDPEFSEAWNEAYEAAIDLMEEKARERAFDGVLEPVYHQGKVVGHIRKYSDTLSIFLMKGARPKKFRDNTKVEHSGDLAVKHTGHRRVTFEFRRPPEREPEDETAGKNGGENGPETDGEGA